MQFMDFQVLSDIWMEIKVDGWINVAAFVEVSAPDHT